MSGLYDVNNFGSLLSDASLGSGSYSVSSNGRGTVQFPTLQTGGSSFIGALNLTYYVIDGSTALFIETDDNQSATGTLALQGASGGAPAVLSRFTPIRLAK
jgi:hypothetical protein